MNSKQKQILKLREKKKIYFLILNKHASNQCEPTGEKKTEDGKERAEGIGKKVRTLI